MESFSLSLVAVGSATAVVYLSVAAWVSWLRRVRDIFRWQGIDAPPSSSFLPGISFIHPVAKFPLRLHLQFHSPEIDHRRCCHGSSAARAPRASHGTAPPTRPPFAFFDRFPTTTRKPTTLPVEIPQPRRPKPASRSIPLLAPGPRVLHRATARDPVPHPSSAATCSIVGEAAWCLGVSRGSGGGHGARRGVGGGRGVRAEAAYFGDLSVPVEMGEIHNMDTLDAALASSVDHNQPIIIDWMASWCRKCIYLKPKMEKIAGEFPGLFVDVNKVPHAVVKRKMPTIQVLPWIFSRKGASGFSWASTADQVTAGTDDEEEQDVGPVVRWGWGVMFASLAGYTSA
ncbi:hypothetical protein ZWY2020_058592 [Hordeum vulgare]|nr:hypothetical protein ZWY2020_058592 [Hordeum vulgare]